MFHLLESKNMVTACGCHWVERWNDIHARFEFFTMAEAVRFELTNGSHRRQFSRLVPSTARPRFLSCRIIPKSLPDGRKTDANGAGSSPRSASQCALGWRRCIECLFCLRACHRFTVGLPPVRPNSDPAHQSRALAGAHLPEMPESVSIRAGCAGIEIALTKLNSRGTVICLLGMEARVPVAPRVARCLVREQPVPYSLPATRRCYTEG